MPTAISIDVDGRLLLWLDLARYWRPENVASVVAELAVPLDDLSTPVSMSQPRREYPRAIGWWRVHERVLGGLQALVIFAILVPLILWAAGGLR